MDKKLRGTSRTRNEIRLPSRFNAQKEHSPSNTKKRRSFQGTQAQNEQYCNIQDDKSISVTLSTVSCTSGDSSCFNAQERKASVDSSCFNAQERKKDGNYKCSICEITILTASISVDEEEDGYATDQAVVFDTDSPCTREKPILSITKQRHKLELDRQEQHTVKQIVEQLLQEQRIALEAWNDVASEYQQRTEPFTSMFVPHLLDPKYLLPLSDIQSLKDECLYLKGKSVLDVAAGTGAGALYAASKGASSVMATDFSENMLQVLKSRADDHPSHIIETKVANGLCLPPSWGNEYDITISNFGIIYFPKVKEGLREMSRCAKPGGKVCISGWGTREETDAFNVFPAALKRCGLDRTWIQAQSLARKHLLALTGMIPLSSKTHQRRRRPYRGISLTPNFCCPTTRISSSQCVLTKMMVDVGLEDVHVIPVTNDLRLDSAESYWNRFVLASPNLKRFVEQCLNAQEVVRLKHAVLEILHEEHEEFLSHSEEGGVVLKASAYIAIGTKTSPRKRRSRKDAKNKR